MNVNKYLMRGRVPARSAASARPSLPAFANSSRARDLLRRMNDALDSADGELTSGFPSLEDPLPARDASSSHASSSAPARRPDLKLDSTATRAALLGAMLTQLLAAADSRADELAQMAAREVSHLQSLGIHLDQATDALFSGLASTGTAALDQMTLLASLAVTELSMAGSGTALHPELHQTLQSTLHALQATEVASTALSPSLVEPPVMVQSLIAAVLHSLTDLVAAVDLTDPTLSPMARSLLNLVQSLGHTDPLVLAACGTGLVALIAVSLPKDGGAAEDAVPRRYNPDTVAAYMGKRPLVVLRRSLVVAAEALHILSLLVSDWQSGKWEANMPRRAVQAREAVERLGPTYIKLAQLMSTRVDMFPKPYITEFSKLQDRVKPFSTEQARDILTEELGRPPEDVFAFLSERPVAAASIGQVYRGRLREQYGGTDVAVKVQRPNILRNSALDLYVLRRILMGLAALPGMSDRSDLVGLLDEWSSRFFLEMDYTHEAENAMRFKAQMASIENVTVAHVFADYSTRRVLTTEWVKGEKLSESRAEDVKSLVTVMLNCYLIQLLETGFLHADPHPGNLIRTPDGKICLLDFGLMAEISQEQREALVEFIAHLTNKDWEGLVGTMVELGFIPHDAPDPYEAGFIPMLSTIMGQIVDGGGAGRISFSTLMTQMEGLAGGYPMRVPPYFALIFRAFGVLEGIALKIDPEYSIVLECFPYLSRRLLTDSSEHSRVLLRQMLYTDQGRLDVRRLQRLANGFRRYSTQPTPAALGSSGGSNGPSSSSEDPSTSAPLPQRRSSRTQMAVAASSSATADFAPTFSGSATATGAARASKGAARRKSARRKSARSPSNLDPSVKDALRIVFHRQGSFMQEILVEELVAAVDALSREAISELVRLLIGSAGVAAALGEMEALGPVTPLVVQPLAMPLEALASLIPQVELTEEDEEALDNVQALWELLQPSLFASPTPQTARAFAFVLIELLQMAPELLPGLQSTSGKFLRQLLGRIASRLAEELQRPALPAVSQAVSYSSFQAPGGAQGGNGAPAPRPAGF